MTTLIKKTLIFITIVFSSFASANSSVCPGTTIENLHETSSSVSNSDNGSIAANTTYYYTFTAKVNGSIKVDSTLDVNQNSLYIKNNCSDNLWSATNNSTSKVSPFIRIDADQQVIIAITNGSNSQSSNYNINFIFEPLITIEPEQKIYQISEDYESPIGSTNLLETKIVLSSPANYDVSFSYTTVDGTAIAGLDYRAVSGTITIPAGETEAKIYIAIIHDIEIELQESFYLEISNVTPSDHLEIGNNNPAEIQILEQGAQNVPICYEDDFEVALDDKWRTLFSNGSFNPSTLNGRLRLTPGQTNIATAVTKDYEFASKYNMIVVEFSQYAYGGCGNGGGLGDYGADGIVAVLYDSVVGASPTPGAYGGSMGYAQGHGKGGFEGGWLGLGIDEYGNFANATEGRVGGLSGSLATNRNRAVVRGDGVGMSGYNFLKASDQLNPAVASKSSTVPYPGHKYRMTADARDPNKLLITLERDTGIGYQVIINTFDAKDPIYSQTTTPDLVRLAFTAGTGGGCNNHEIDNLKVRGICRAYNPIPTPSTTSLADMVDDFTLSGYNFNTKYLKTKISDKLEPLTAVYLNESSDAAIFNSVNPNLYFKVIPYVSDETCTQRTPVLDSNGNPLVINIANGYDSATDYGRMPNIAKKIARFSLSALDMSKIYEASGDTCLLNSSTTGNLQGIGQCINSESKYREVFGDTAWERCYNNNGGPCESQNGGYGTGIYNDEYGCLMCTLDSNTSCSSDNFAIRPESLVITSTDSHFSDLLRAGEEYNTTIHAYSYSSTTNTPDYNITNAASQFDINTTKYNKNDIIDNSMSGSMSFGTTVFDMHNGISSITGIVGNEVAEIKFSDVGKVNIRIEDRTWAQIDENDTKATCGIDGRYICGDLNATFIPHHFDFEGSQIENGNGTFTYIANERDQMNARINANIRALSKDDSVVQNFSVFPLYENSISVTPVVQSSSYIYPDANETIITDLILGFNSGVINLPGNEANSSRNLVFNFKRDTNTTANPFMITGNDLNITATSIYTGTAPEGTATIEGASIMSMDGNATFVYGRTNAPKHRFIGNNGNALIYYEVFCDLASGCNKSLLPGLGENAAFTDHPQWFTNTAHTNIASGTIGAINEKNGAARVTLHGAVSLNNGVTTAPLLYDDTTRGYPYKTTMQNNASSWLIYHPYTSNPISNEFEVEFDTANSNWAGVRETTTSSDSDSTSKTNRRVMW